MNDLPPEAIEAAEMCTSTQWCDNHQLFGLHRADATPPGEFGRLSYRERAIAAQAAATERERIRQQFLGVVTANVSEGLDTVYGALLDAIRELGQ